MIYLFDKDEKLIKIIRKPAIKTALQKYSLTKERYVSDRLTVEMKSLNDDELEKVEYMAIQTMEDAHTFHYFYVAQKSSENLTTLIGVQSGIEELRKSPVFDKRPKNAFAKNVINDLLKGTNWQARFVGETTQRSTSFYYISVFDALKKACEVWDLEMQFFVEMNGNRIGARYIDFKRKIGQAVGKRVVYGHNALQILQEVERTNIFTALVGRGKGEQVSSAEESGKQANGFGRKITFEDVVWSTASGKPINKPKGQKYVELPAMTKLYGIKNADGSMRPKIGFVEFAEEENPEVLIERTYKALVDAARPQLTLKTSSVYLRGAKVGDTIRVVRHDKKLDYDTRIFEITFNRLNDQSSDIKLGDRIGESNEAKAQTIAEKVVDDFVSNEFSDFVQKLPDFLPSPDGFNNNWYGAEDPTVKYPGKVLINDIWFKPDPEHEGHKIMLRWTGEVWDEIVRSYDKESLTKRISEEIANFDKTFQSVNEQNKKKIDEILQSSGASNLLAQEAKRIGLDSITKLEEFKRQTFNTQSALSGAIDALKRTVTSEVNQASEYRRTTTEALSRMTGQMNGFATKSEVKQGIDGLTETFTKMSVGGVNLLRNTSSLLIGDRSKGYWMSSSGGNGRAISVEVLDPPKNMIKNMIRIIGNTNGGNKDLAQFVRLLIGEKYTVSCYARVASDSSNANVNLLFRSWANDTDLNQKFQKSISHKNWQKYSFTFTANAIENSIQFGQSGAGIIEICAPKIESGTLATDWSPALEDTEGIITEAKATFEQTADGLRTDLSAIQEYVNKDGQRKEELQRYTREESARQASAVRELVSRDYVGKATYQEDVRGIERRFEAITNPRNGTIATQIANYKQSVDGRFAGITSLISGKANQTDFQRVKETSQLYERILGNTDNGIADNVARMAVTNQIFQVEVGKYGGGGPNLVKNSDFKDGMNEWTSKQNLGILVKHGFYHNGQKNLMRLSNSTQSDIFLNSPRFELERNTDYVLNFRGFNNGALVSYDVFILGRKAGETSDFSIAKKVVDAQKLSTSRCEDVSITFNSGEMDNAFIRFDNNGVQSGTADLYITEVDLYKGYKPRPWQPHPEDIVTDANAKLETIRTQMTLLQGSWAVRNLTSAGSIVSQINATNNQILIEAEKIRLKGKTLLDELTAIDGYFKRLFVGEGTFATLNADVIRTNSITADKLVINEALANRLVSNEIITSKLVASRAFVNALKAVTIDASQIVTGTLKGDRIYGGTIRGTDIYGATLTGHTKIQLGTYGSFDTVDGGLQINVPRTVNSKDGLGVQFIGSYGRGENVPYGLFVYKDSDLTTDSTVLQSDDFLMTVEGYIKAKGIGWFKIDTGNVGGKLTSTIGLWNSNNVYLSFGGSGNDIYYSYNGSAYSLWSVVKQHFSDRRLKENIVDCKHKALDYIRQFQFKEYDWKKQEDRPQQAHTKIGLIAQEVQAVDPTLVYENGDTLNLDNLRLTNIALKAIQELSQRIETLERKLA